MNITVKYIGSQSRWHELPYTGKQSVWMLGMIDTRDSAEADLLLKTGQFENLSDDVLTAAQAAAAAVVIDGLAYKSSLTTALDTGFGAWSHARASGTSNGTVVDHAGLMHECLAGETRRYGSRRVANMVADSEGLTTGWTLGASTTKAAVPLLLSPSHPRPSVWNVTRSSGAAVMLTLNSQRLRQGKWTFSVWLRGNGVQTIRLRIENLASSTGTNLDVVPPSNVWTRYSVAHDVADTTSHRAYITNGTSGAASFTLCDPQLEFTHNTTGAPSEYVARGVVGFPAALITAGADGVQYFDTLNKWSVSSGVATQAATAAVPIPAATMKGILIEPLTVQKPRSSRDIGSGSNWVLSDVTAGGAMTDSTLLGKNSLRKMVETATTAAHRVTQAWAGTLPPDNTILSASAYVKAGERSIAYLGIVCKDNSTIFIAFFDLANGTITNNGNSTQREAYMYAEGDLIRICASCNGLTGVSAPTVYFGMCKVAGTTSYLGTLTEGMSFGALQFEEAEVSTSYVGDTDTSTGLVRQEDYCYVDTNTQFPRVDYTMALQFTPMFPTAVASKKDWYYIMYSQINLRDRGGWALRPGTYAGYVANGEDNWVMDFYPNVQGPGETAGEIDLYGWDGIELDEPFSAATQRRQPLETVMLLASVSNSPQTGPSNLAGYVGSMPMVHAHAGYFNGINTWGSLPRRFYFGRDKFNGAQRCPMCIKDVVFTTGAQTLDAMAVHANGGTFC